MNQIGRFFEKFIRLNQNSDLVKSKVLEVVDNITHVSLSLSDIQLKEGILSLSCSPAVRGEIMMNREKIIASLLSSNIKIKNIR